LAKSFNLLGTTKGNNRKSDYIYATDIHWLNYCQFTNYWLHLNSYITSLVQCLMYISTLLSEYISTSCASYTSHFIIVWWKLTMWDVCILCLIC